LYGERIPLKSPALTIFVWNHHHCAVSEIAIRDGGIKLLLKWLVDLLGVLIILWLFVASNAVIIIGGRQIGIMERKYFGRRLSEGRVIALRGETGVQAGTLAPGLHILFPFLYRVQKVAFVEIGQNEIGCVESIDGMPIESGRILGRSVSGHNFFQNGEEFLKNSGEKGPQVDIIPPGVYRINTAMFKVEIGRATVIAQGSIGVVNATDGKTMDKGRLLAKYVEGHNNFQNGNDFLVKGAQKGPQLDILLPGTYRINPLLFEVKAMEAAAAG